jgi:hypothetical protein
MTPFLVAGLVEESQLLGHKDLSGFIFLIFILGSYEIFGL